VVSYSSSVAATSISASLGTQPVLVSSTISVSPDFTTLPLFKLQFRGRDYYLEFDLNCPVPCLEREGIEE
ncbi:unnamed protein product, partial [Prunus brigantina]